MRLSTGIDELDRHLGGGVEPGSLVAVVAPPAAQVEPLLCASIHLRPTRYYTTLRTEERVRRRLDRSGDDPEIATVEHVGVDGALDAIQADLPELGEGHDLVVDPVDPLESGASTARYVDFLTALSNRLLETDGVALLSCLDSGREPEKRELTLSAADAVWRLVPRPSSSKLAYSLELPKVSGVALSAEDRVFDLAVGTYVSIDRTRNI